MVSREQRIADAGAAVTAALARLHSACDGDEAAVGECMYEIEKAARLQYVDEPDDEFEVIPGENQPETPSIGIPYATQVTAIMTGDDEVSLFSICPECDAWIHEATDEDGELISQAYQRHYAVHEVVKAADEVIERVDANEWLPPDLAVGLAGLKAELDDWRGIPNRRGKNE